ncbi:hypothetical protein AVEN_208584-1 [Araneus ventricosus]|uniref:Uncharacterized protein n=1 Tax=Araneus ventricosus TaxID=182803 RepID=A0A4Y2C8F8_ARAVE|nr:hypothetical protein AVEN_208584-1 [Araneus ventricosus]
MYFVQVRIANKDKFLVFIRAVPALMVHVKRTHVSETFHCEDQSGRASIPTGIFYKKLSGGIKISPILSFNALSILLNNPAKEPKELTNIRETMLEGSKR